MVRLSPWLRWLLGITALRAILAAIVPVAPEEAYHWEFARHLDWSYLDHPGMIAWSIALGRLCFGDTPLGIRAVPLLFATGTVALLARLARRIYDDPRDEGRGERAATWTVWLFSMAPLPFLTASSGFPDSPLLFFWSLALSSVWEALRTRRGPWWLLAGFALGAGAVSKYTVVFLGVSILGYLVTSRAHRRWLLTPWPYAGAAVALAVFTPVLVWNAGHDWASLRFQSVGRLENARTISVASFLKFAGGQWAAAIPLTIPLAVVALRRAVRSPLDAERFLFWCFLPMIAFFFLLSWTMPIHALWPLPSWIGVFILMAGLAAGVPGAVSRRGPLVFILSSVPLVGFCLHLAFPFPFAPLAGGLHGWKAVADRAHDLRARLPAGSFYLGLGRKYTVASELAFHLHSPEEVYGRTLIGESELQFDYWADPGALKGHDAVVVVEKGHRNELEPALLRHFGSVELQGELECVPGRPKGERYLFYVGRDYRPPAVPVLPGVDGIRLK
jgi:4-amino-4-deoxy-L-arabinose transferase-like glycosyltransferase